VVVEKKAGGVAPAALRDPQLFVDNILRLAATGR